MTWFGKILTFVVMVLSIMWMYFSVQSFVTRTNWKTHAEKLEVALKERDAALVAERQRYQGGDTAVKGLLLIEQGTSYTLSKDNELLSKKLADTSADFRKLQEAYAKGDVEAEIAKAARAKLEAEQLLVRDRNVTLENDRVALRLEVENAKKDEVKSRNNAKLAQQIADDYSRKVEDLVAKVTELRSTGGSTNPLRAIERPPPPVLSSLRGEVTDVAGDLLTISVGIDSGMAVGTVLDLYRIEGGGKYLGTVKVTSALNLFPKQAIVTFTPARRDLPFDRLPVADLPKKGDQVRPPEALTGSR